MTKKHNDVGKSPADTRADAPATVSIPVKKARSVWARVAMLLLILVLLAGLVAGFLWVRRAYDKSMIGRLRDDVATQRTRLETAEKERVALENRIAGMETVARLGVGNDEEQIKTAAKQYGSTFLKDGNSADAQLSKRDGNQAVATLTSAQGKHNVYLKKTNDTWVSVWAGKTTPTEAQRRFYGLTIE